MSDVTVKKALELGLGLTAYVETTLFFDSKEPKWLIRYNGNYFVSNLKYNLLDLTAVDPDNVPENVVFLVPTMLEIEDFVPMNIQDHPDLFTWRDQLVEQFLPKETVQQARQLLNDGFKKAFIESNTKIYQKLDFKLVNRRL